MLYGLCVYVCVHVITCYVIVAVFIGSVCEFGKDCGIQVQKYIFFQKKILSYLMGFEIF